MTLVDCRSFLETWRLRMGAAALAGGLSFAAATGQEKTVTTAKSPAVASASTATQTALRTLNAGERTSTASRMHAIDALATSIWQADPELEHGLIAALRADPSENVRAHAASCFAKSRFVTPRAFDALQCAAIGSNRDGFPGERDLAVKLQANEALKKHPTSADPRSVAKLRQQSGHRPGVWLSAPPGALDRGGAEESSPPASLPTVLPPPTPIPVVVTPAPPPTVPPAPRLTPAPATASTPTPAIVSSPSAAPKKAAPPPPLPASGIVRTISIPEPPPTARSLPKAVDRSPEKSSDAKSGEDVFPNLPPMDPNVSLWQLRAELREQGLNDSTMKRFTSEIGAPPPTTASPSWWRARPATSPSVPAPTVTQIVPAESRPATPVRTLPDVARQEPRLNLPPAPRIDPLSVLGDPDRRPASPPSSPPVVVRHENRPTMLPTSTLPEPSTGRKTSMDTQPAVPSVPATSTNERPVLNAVRGMLPAVFRPSDQSQPDVTIPCGDCRK